MEFEQSQLTLRLVVSEVRLISVNLASCHSLACSADFLGIFEPEDNMSTSSRRGEVRVKFERGIDAYLMAIDGTWRRDCIMEDVSETGAKLTIKGSIERLQLKEFFLLLSSTGLAYRRCELAWVNGDQIGTRFVTQARKGPTANHRRRDAPTDKA